eukprot:15465976-Alexandrium_andersonii.AAC.1
MPQSREASDPSPFPHARAGDSRASPRGDSQQHRVVSDSHVRGLESGSQAPFMSQSWGADNGDGAGIWQRVLQRPLHAHSGVRLGEASNPGPPETEPTGLHGHPGAGSESCAGADQSLVRPSFTLQSINVTSLRAHVESLA